MQRQPATPEDVHQIAERVATVKAVLAEWRAGNVSWEGAMMWAVVALANANEKLCKRVVEEERRKAPEPNALRDMIQKHTSHILATRLDFIERLGAGFLHQTGLNPRECELVEEHKGEAIHWHFRKRAPSEAEASQQADEFGRLAAENTALRVRIDELVAASSPFTFPDLPDKTQKAIDGVLRSIAGNIAQSLQHRQEVEVNYCTMLGEIMVNSMYGGAPTVADYVGTGGFSVTISAKPVLCDWPLKKSRTRLVIGPPALAPSPAPNQTGQ